MLTLGPPVVSIAGSNLTLNETDSYVIPFAVDEGIPLSGPPAVYFNNMSLTNNARVNISNNGLQINNVVRSDAGEYRVTWSNDGGNATFVLRLKVNCKIHVARCVLYCYCPI